jgi:hypothetical protein
LTDIASSRVSAALKSALKDPDLVKRFNDINADFCQALAPLGEFFAESKISRLI